MPNVSVAGEWCSVRRFRFGVALSFLGTENEGAVRALGVTVLPLLHFQSHSDYETLIHVVTRRQTKKGRLTEVGKEGL